MQQAEQIAALVRAAEAAAWSAADVEKTNAARYTETDKCRHHLECAARLANTFGEFYWTAEGEIKEDRRGGDEQ